MTELVAIAQGVYAWLHDHPTHGRTNAGVVVEADGITVIDSLASPVHATELADALAPFALPIRRLVLTSSHIEYSGGSSVFSLAAVYGTPQVSAHLDQPPPDPAALRRLLPEVARDLPDELVTRPVSHTVREAAYISGAVAVLPLPGELDQNLLATVPGADTVFTGALCTFGVTPLAFDGDLSAWADSLDVIVDMGEIFVPGHGAVGGVEEVRALQGYLRACVDASGDLDRLANGPWDGWAARDLDEINVERAFMLSRGDRSPPPTMLRRLGMV